MRCGHFLTNTFVSSTAMSDRCLVTSVERDSEQRVSSRNIAIPIERTPLIVKSVSTRAGQWRATRSIWWPPILSWLLRRKSITTPVSTVAAGLLCSISTSGIWLFTQVTLLECNTCNRFTFRNIRYHVFS